MAILWGLLCVYCIHSPHQTGIRFTLCSLCPSPAKPSHTARIQSWFMKSQNKLWLSSCIQQCVAVALCIALGGCRYVHRTHSGIQFRRFRARSRRLSHKNDNNKKQETNLLDPRQTSYRRIRIVCAPIQRPLSQWVDERNCTLWMKRCDGTTRTREQIVAVVRSVLAGWCQQ